MTETNMFRDVKVSPLMLDEETFEPFYTVKMRFYGEMQEDLKCLHTTEEERMIVGKEFCAKLDVARKAAVEEMERKQTPEDRERSIKFMDSIKKANYKLAESHQGVAKLP